MFMYGLSVEYVCRSAWSPASSCFHAVTTKGGTLESLVILMCNDNQHNYYTIHTILHYTTLYIHTYIYTHARTYTHTHAHTYTHIHAHTHTHTYCTLTHSHSHTHTHTHKQTGMGERHRSLTWQMGAFGWSREAEQMGESAEERIVRVPATGSQPN